MKRTSIPVAIYKIANASIKSQLLVFLIQARTLSIESLYSFSILLAIVANSNDYLSKQHLNLSYFPIEATEAVNKQAVSFE